MVLNAETERRRWLWTLKLRSDDDSERQNENATLNTKRERDMMALNVELKMQRDNEGKICPNVACCYNSQSMEMVWNKLHENHDNIRKYGPDQIMTTSENMGPTKWLKKGSIRESRQSEVKSSAQRASRNWGWSCKSMEIYKSQLKKEYAPVWNQVCDRSKKSNGLKSSIIECVVLVIHVHNWIRLTNKKGVPQKGRYDDIRMPKNVGQTEWLKKGSTGGSW